MTEPEPTETTETPPQRGDPRVYMAAERTLLAWVRTGLALMGFGFVVARFGMFLRTLAVAEIVPASRGHALSQSLWLGIALVALGVGANVAAALRFSALGRDLRAGRPFRATRWDAGVILAVLLAVLGVVMVAYLVAVAR